MISKKRFDELIKKVAGENQISFATATYPCINSTMFYGFANALLKAVETESEVVAYFSNETNAAYTPEQVGFDDRDNIGYELIALPLVESEELK
jgi:hypothetical protein